MGNLLIVAAG